MDCGRKQGFVKAAFCKTGPGFAKRVCFRDLSGGGDTGMEHVLYEYYENNAQKLHKAVDKILLKFGGISDKDLDDFYSLANEVFVDVIKKYDSSQPFEVFLHSCLTNKIKTEISRRNREKRTLDRVCVSIDTPVGDDEETTIGDLIADDFTIEGELFGDGEEGYGRRVLEYLNRLSGLQREVLRLKAEGFFPNEIREKLHISEKQYADSYAAIHSYRNVSLLF